MLNSNEKTEKAGFTDAERLELAAKLDEELDDFIEGLERKRYDEGWPEDRWQEEMEKHPFFMKRAPQPGDEVHPLFEGLQKLKYDPEENTAEDLALNYKVDGNFYMKHKKFRMAVYSFTEGLKANCNNTEVNSILYNNRSAAHFFLHNYRSSLADAEKALALNPDYAKARWRAAQCAYHLNKYKQCIQHCSEIVDSGQNAADAKELMRKVKLKKIESERNERKALAEAKKKFAEFHHLVEALKISNVKFEGLKEGGTITRELLKPTFLPLEDFPVHFDENGVLIWPSAFSYPEFLISDFHQNLSEEVTMKSVIETMFSEQLPCDKEGKYKPDKLSVYYENRAAAKVCKVNLNKCIADIVSEKNFYVCGGSLLFYIVPSRSRVEEEFVKRIRKPMVYTK